MHKALRTIVGLSLGIAVLAPVRSIHSASAEASFIAAGESGASRFNSGNFRPAQANATSSATGTPSATVVPTGTPVSTATTLPLPTATDVPGTPDASSLLAAARAALKSANTSHFDVKERLNLAGLVKGTVREQGDMSQHPSKIRAHVTGSLIALGKPQKLDEHHVQLGKKAWVKSAKTHGRWKAEKPTAITSAGSVQNPLDLVKGNGLKLNGLKTVDAETYAGVPVWRIHGTVIARVSQTTSTNGTVDYLIARNGNLPYRILEYVSDPKDALLLDLRVTLSAFGEKVTVPTPKVGGTLQ